MRKFAGTFTALITPFKNDGGLDEESLRALIEKQVAAGVDGIMPLGTTGESPTIHEDEFKRVIEIAVEVAGGKILVVPGTGSNSTEKSVKMTKIAKEAGADGCLVVCPYYNKPTAEGLYRHYTAIAAVGLPIVIYNIKGRTGINMDTDTLMRLAENEIFVAVKEASGDLNQMREVISRRPESLAVLSGDDGLTYDLMKLGGDGVISVASNIFPEKVCELVKNPSEELNQELAELFDKLFVETNPIPVKYCAHKMGLCELNYRLPMCEPTADSQKVLDELLKKYL